MKVTVKKDELSFKASFGFEHINFNAETADLEANTVASQPFNDTSSSFSVNKVINELEQAQCSPVSPQFWPPKKQNGQLQKTCRCEKE